MKIYSKLTPAINSLIAGLILMAGILNTAQAEEQTTRERVLHHRAMEAAIWAMPIMNYKFYRDALIGAGVGPNDVGYYSKVQDWKFQKILT